MLSPDLNEVRVRPHKRSGAELGTHKRSCPDWKHEPAARMLSPGLSEARVQHPTSVGSVSANPNEVRVRPHKRSGAELGRELEASNALPLYPARTRNAVRVPAANWALTKKSCPDWALTKNRART